MSAVVQNLTETKNISPTRRLRTLKQATSVAYEAEVNRVEKRWLDFDWHGTLSGQIPFRHGWLVSQIGERLTVWEV